MSSNLPPRGNRRAGGSTPSAPGAAATEGQRAEQSRERSSARTDARAAQRDERDRAARGSKRIGTGEGIGAGKGIGKGIGTGKGIGRGKDEVRATELGSRRQPTSSDDGSGSPERPARARDFLSSPRAARRGIVLRELLGPPVSLRRARSDVPGLSP